MPLLVDPVCEMCGEPSTSSGSETRVICGGCLSRQPAFDRARSAVVYGGAVKAAVQMLKFQNAFWLAPDLAMLMEGCVRHHFDLSAIDEIVPVPLHGVRFRHRTANQAELLGRALGRRIGVSVMADVVVRRRATQRQTDLSRSERRKNLRGAFEVVRPEWVDQRSLLVVDDVMTTGATAAAISTVLKRAGAANVWFVTVARGTQTVRMDEKAKREWGEQDAK